MRDLYLFGSICDSRINGGAKISIKSSVIYGDKRQVKCIYYVDILNSESRILQCCRTTWELTLQDINTTPKELKIERYVAIDSCFALFGARKYGVTTRDQTDEKISAHSDFSPDPELLIPTESPHTTCLLGGKRPSVKLMSRRENKELAKNNLKNTDKTMQEIQHIFYRSVCCISCVVFTSHCFYLISNSW